MEQQQKILTFWDHLEELRHVLFRIAVAVVFLMLVAFLFKDELFAIVLAPKNADFIIYRFFCRIADFMAMPSLCPEVFYVKMINTQLAAQFITHMSVSFYTGFLLASPYVIYQLFRFVSPALYENEKKYSTRIVGWGYFLFMMGVLLNYFLIFPLTFRFLATYQVSMEVENTITLSSYMDTLMMMSLMLYLAGVSVRRVEDITEALWGSKVSPATISELNKKAYVHIEDWRNRPLRGGRYPYVYVDGIYLRRNWGGEYENVAILVAIAVNEDGFREVLGAAEGMKEDKASWVSFFQWLRGRGLDGVKLIVGDKCMGMLEAVGEVFPDAKYQRCTVHFYRNIFSVVPKSKVKIVAKMLKAIHAQESKKASREKAKAVVAELRAMKLKEAAKKVEDGIEETLTYCDFPSEHWTRIRTNNVIERLNREIRRRTRVVGTFPDGNSALMLVCARLRHVAGTQWGSKKYMNMKHLEAALDDASIAG